MNTSEAHEAGRAAYHAGRPCAPPYDLFGDGPVGTADLAIPRAWIAGWHDANLADTSWED